MSNVNRRNIRRGNIAPKSASRAARAKAYANADRHAYSRADIAEVRASLPTPTEV
jgi:hypothetical protein